MRFTFTLLLVFAFVAVTFAQHEHPTLTPSEMIDGSQHPDMVPDVVAYRLVFLMLSDLGPTSNFDPKARQRAFLKKVGLSDLEIEKTIPILADFRTRYTALMSEFNRQAEEALEVGNATDTGMLLVNRAILVEQSRNGLRAVLTNYGYQLFDAYVRGEKEHMKVPAKETL